MKHFLEILDHSSEDLLRVLDTADKLKTRMKGGISDRLLIGKSLGMYFEKASLRTRVSLEVAMNSMGGCAINLETGGKPLGLREAIKDQAQVMSRYVNIISIRCFAHETVIEMAKYSNVPIINALSDYNHPTQAMADILTVRERLGSLEGRTLAYVGDGNNVARSLAAVCARFGMNFTIGCPHGYEIENEFIDRVKGEMSGNTFLQTNDPIEAVTGADIVYTDVWASMGQEDEAEERKRIFAPYQLNNNLMANAADGAIVLHCLPAHRGDEITDEVIDSAASAVFDQAENRMHIYRALFYELLELSMP